MSDWLVVLIAAPLASFGEEPGNARRGTADRPSRSALIGLAGAALGVTRDDAEEQETLRDSFFTATRTLRPGELLADFHTYQSLPAAKGPVATRADALRKRGDVETTITRRDYRADGLWQAAFAPREGGRVPLEALRDAFLKPRFALWAGRKSCALGPLAPMLLSGMDLEAAFLLHAEAIVRAGVLRGPFANALRGETDSLIAEDARLPSGRNDAWLKRRVDEPGDRFRWHFSARQERTYHLAPRAAADGRSP